MKKLENFDLENIKGGGLLSNKICSRLGIVVTLAAISQQWGSVFAVSGAAAVGGCFDNW